MTNKGNLASYTFENAIEGLSVDFLRACGITVKFDEGHMTGKIADFYYGGKSDGRGAHNPIRRIEPCT